MNKIVGYGVFGFWFGWIFDRFYEKMSRFFVDIVRVWLSVKWEFNFVCFFVLREEGFLWNFEFMRGNEVFVYLNDVVLGDCEGLLLVFVIVNWLLYCVCGFESGSF